ncbi:hypothetical protein HCX50_03925 [Microbacterium oxydans]|uniref:hypothetical protein n=1 Tax=Microbacterium sp. B19(2022) TaxID=2914045 RepID=UPI001430AC06|nr:hypothetical protein [Microbacterium sp. B19(2022)]NJI58574.1 hypothetical protein [Microbacterium sp. B19(2022)]
MSGPDSPVIGVEDAPSRWSPWWLASGALFIASALLAAFRSLPGSGDVNALVGVSTAATLAFSLALVAAGIGAVRHDHTLRLPRVAIISLFLLAVWLPVALPVLTASFGITSAAPLYLNALVKLGLSGAIVAGVLRSVLPSPWRLIPAIALAVVVLGSLLEVAFMSGSVTDQGAMILVSNVLTLVRILATGALGAVALRAARSRAGSVVVFGG